MSLRMVLRRQCLALMAQEQAQLDRFLAAGREIELRAPVAGHAIGQRLGIDIGNAAARSRDEGDAEP